ncbi:MAG: ATP-binding protein, partial [Limnochordales bacterium]
TQTVRMANAAAALVLNVPPADAPGRPLSAVAAHEQLPGLFAQVISHRTAVEATMTGANPEAGRTRTFRVHVAPVTDESGRIRGAVGLFHDDSETVQLQKLRREFIADVSHELRTPLTSVRGFLEAIADGVPRSEEEAGEYLRIAIDETARLQRLADALLEASSIALGGVAFEPVHVPLEPAVRTVVDRVMPQAAARGMTVEVDVPGGLRVWADADKLDRILLNLLDNALHYGRDGGRVTVAARSAGDFVEVSVEDDGPGIPEAEQPLVWERFYKVDKARRKAAGSGLGLVIVRQLVELHGGRVGLHSRPGRGSRFYFTLPVRAEARTGRG